ncbi:WecB/TagA/CpsF family glycosyltransferase [Candidatus Sumerlaeota bacterium]|nr:WecB/TagA/CpsF family glycosyltransferase [Candidatus Sumerlaeota bacterium]
MSALATVPFLGLKLVRCTTGEFIQWVVNHARDGQSPCRIGYLNAAQVNLAFDSAQAAELLGQMDILYADGQAVVWAARRLGSPVAERINAGDFTEKLLAECASRGLRIALIGGRPGDAEGFAAHFQRRVQGLQIAFTHHGYFESEEEERILAELEKADPHLVLIGMGSPLQERCALRWSRRRSEQVGPRVWWCVGALFEFASGRRTRAPLWARRAGLEWLVRLVLEPGRLWQRYLIGNPKFAWRVLKSKPIAHAGGGSVRSSGDRSDVSGDSPTSASDKRKNS